MTSSYNSAVWDNIGKSYELTNHLGNVMAVISENYDVNSNGDREVVVNNENDYYAFGSMMPGRTFSLDTTKYRFGFNGHERDDEIYGTGNLNTAEFWEYDARLGRRWNRDPIVKAWQSGYATFDDNPIYFSDPTGAIAEDPIVTVKEDPCPECKGIKLNEVIVTAKIRNLLGRFFKEVNNFLADVEAFSFGAANSFTSNQVLGIGRADANKFGSYSKSVQTGQTIGDVVSIITGAGEIGAAAIGEGAGLLLDATGVGALAGVPLGIAGVAVGTHGATVIGTATANLISDQVSKTHDNANGNSESGGSSGDYSKEPPGETIKLKGNQGWKDKDGNIWKKDMKHKDHWDITDPKTNKKVREVDFNNRQIWPNGVKNKNKK